jgi:DNA-binding transcriptional LysR family regulator
MVERKLREAGVPISIAMQVPGTEGVKRAVQACLGVGMVSSFAVESECLTGVLRRVPIEGWRLIRSMNLVYRSQKYFSPVGERFREFAKTYGKSHLEPFAHEPKQRATAGGPRKRHGLTQE